MFKFRARGLGVAPGGISIIKHISEHSQVKNGLGFRGSGFREGVAYRINVTYIVHDVMFNVIVVVSGNQH